MIPYKHEPFTDFTVEENKQAYLEALKTVEGYLGQDYPLIIGGERHHDRREIGFYKPCK